MSKVEPATIDTLLQYVVSALADIAFSEDITLEQIRHKARRIYEEIQRALEEQEE